VVVLSEGKSFLPVDVHLPVASEPPRQCGQPHLDLFRQFLAARSSSGHAAKFAIPDEVTRMIQDDFVSRRKAETTTAEAGLKRRMKLARLMALSMADARLSEDVWKRTIELDARIQARQMS